MKAVLEKGTIEGKNNFFPEWTFFFQLKFGFKLKFKISIFSPFFIRPYVSHFNGRLFSQA